MIFFNGQVGDVSKVEKRYIFFLTCKWEIFQKLIIGIASKLFLGLLF